jgi:hypothetical protein
MLKQNAPGGVVCEQSGCTKTSPVFFAIGSGNPGVTGVARVAHSSRVLAACRVPCFDLNRVIFWSGWFLLILRPFIGSVFSK